MKEIEKFVCVLYGGAKSKFQDVDDLQAFMLKSKCEEKNSFSVINNIDFASFPPSKACLIKHIRRVNYQVLIWKLAKQPIYELPKPSNGHGWLPNGEPYWCPSEWVLPPTFADILEENQLENESDSDSEDDSDRDNQSDSGSDSDNSDSDED